MDRRLVFQDMDLACIKEIKEYIEYKDDQDDTESSGEGSDSDGNTFETEFPCL